MEDTRLGYAAPNLMRSMKRERWQDSLFLKAENIDFQDFTFIFYPVALTISSLFLLATIAVYIIDPDLHRPLFGKITLSFVINNLIAYICLIGQYLGEYFESLATNSLPCIFTGYMILYTFTTFMFWINAMAANIFFKFSSIMSSSSESSGVKFVLYLVYAQGAPLILCLAVFLMDFMGPCSMVRPNMGVAHCFLGDPWGAQVCLKASPRLNLVEQF